MKVLNFSKHFSIEELYETKNVNVNKTTNVKQHLEL